MNVGVRTARDSITAASALARRARGPSLSAYSWRREVWRVASLFCLVWFVGCDLPGKPNARQQPEAGEELAFEPLFQQHCSACHGADGEFGPAPPLNDGLFLAIVPDAELRRVVTSGRPGTPMAAFARSHGGPLTDRQCLAIADGIKQHWKAADIGGNSPPPYTARPMEDGSDSTALAERGAALFSRACSECHGSQGQGGNMAGAINQPAFLQLITDQALRRIIITGRPDLGMPSYAGEDGRDSDFQPLTSDDIDALVAHLNAWRTNRGTPAREQTMHSAEARAGGDRPDAPTYAAGTAE